MEQEHYHAFRARQAREELRPFLEYVLSLGFSQRKIAAALNNLGVKRPMGKPWEQPHISILLNDLNLSTKHKFKKAVYPLL